jgi:hypothetical protein
MDVLSYENVRAGALFVGLIHETVMPPKLFFYISCVTLARATNQRLF